jgi:Mg-chelatase subunit ChlD
MGFKVDLEKTTVGDLQSFIYGKFRIHPLNQLIKFGAKTLLDSTQELHQYGIVENSMLEVNFKPRHRLTALTYSDNFYSQQIQHIFPQSVAALRTFRSNMLVLCHRLPAKIKVKFVALLRELTQNNALACALNSLFNAVNITETHKIALEEGLFTLFVAFLSKAGDVPADYPTDTVFSLTRGVLGFYLDFANKLKDMDEYEQREHFVSFASTCEVTLSQITDPVYIKLDNNTKVVSERSAVLNLIKNNAKFRGVANLSEGNIMEDKDLRTVYELFTYNNKMVEVASLELRQWLPKVQVIDYLTSTVAGLNITCKFKDFENCMSQLNVDLKVFNPLELKTKVDYIYLLKDKNNEEKIYVGKNKDIHTPHSVYDVITGSETAVNFDVLGGVAGSESVEKVVDPVDIKAIVTRDPAEAIVVLLDISGSMGGKFFNEPDLKRIGAVKSFFEAFAYRTMAYNFEHVISLILFDDKIDSKVDFTESFHDFNLLVANAHPRGSTLLYDAMVVATQKLLAFKKRYPNCITRILALTDGEDTGSKSSIVDTAQLLVDSHILVDSFVVGSNCEGLKCITFAAGGKCYLARDLQESLKLFEQETVLSSRSRKI